MTLFEWGMRRTLIPKNVFKGRAYIELLSLTFLLIPHTFHDFRQVVKTLRFSFTVKLLFPILHGDMTSSFTFQFFAPDTPKSRREKERQQIFNKGMNLIQSIIDD